MDQPDDTTTLVGFLGVADDERKVRIYVSNELDSYQEFDAEDVTHVERLGRQEAPYPLVGAWVRGAAAQEPIALEELAGSLVTGELSDLADAAEQQEGVFAWDDVHPETTIPCTIRLCRPVVTRALCTRPFIHNPNPTPLCTLAFC